MKGDARDPRGLIREAYKIDGITASQCRSIFLDWALGANVVGDPRADVEALLVQYADQPPEHPMTQTLLAALKAPAAPRRRGGRASRVKD